MVMRQGSVPEHDASASGRSGGARRRFLLSAAALQRCCSTSAASSFGRRLVPHVRQTMFRRQTTKAKEAYLSLSL